MDMSANSTESFFIPDQFSCQQERLPSQTYNLAHILFNRCQSDHLFVPIRSMQYLAIIEQNAFWFVDSMAYAVQDSEGGRLITVSWHPILSPSNREGLDQHMDCRINFYRSDMSDIHRRLRGEFFQAMQLMDNRFRDTIRADSKIAILPLRSPGNQP